MAFFFFFSSRRRHTRLQGDWSSDVCSSDLGNALLDQRVDHASADVVLAEHDDGAGTGLDGLRLDEARGETRRRDGAREIGRASCRERVEVSVGGGAVQEKGETDGEQERTRI